jgi:exodeoxyribonuclease V alpha subunit
MYKGDCGINEINSRIQDIVNPQGEDVLEVKHYGRVFRENDKVIQLVNRAEKGIMNGDIGYVNSFIRKNDKIAGIVVTFDTLNISYTIEELEDLALAYAISIHKSQGSEFDLVIMPFTTQYFVMLKRKLIYTAITRAKKTLLMIGDVQAMNMGIRKVEIARKTILKEELKNFMNKTSIKEELIKFEKMSFELNLDDDELGIVETDITPDDFK